MTTTAPQPRVAVQIKGGPVLLGLRAMFGVLERCAPRIGGWLAARLWCTPPRASAKRRQSYQPAPGGTQLTIPVLGRQVKAESWGNGPIVYLVHGWGGWGGQLAAFVPPLVDAGYQVVSYDALSHGESEPGRLGPNRSALPEMAATLTAVVDAVGPAHGIIAHSLAGSATAMAVLEGLPVRRLVFIGPLANAVEYTRDFASMLGFGDRIRSRMLQRVEQISDWPVTAYDLPARLRAPGRATATLTAELPSLLVIHDLEDKEVPYSDGQTLATCWPDGELVTTKGLGHRRILRDSGVVDQAVKHLAA